MRCDRTRLRGVSWFIQSFSEMDLNEANKIKFLILPKQDGGRYGSESSVWRFESENWSSKLLLLIRTTMATVATKSTPRAYNELANHSSSQFRSSYFKEEQKSKWDQQVHSIKAELACWVLTEPTKIHVISSRQLVEPKLGQKKCGRWCLSRR